MGIQQMHVKKNLTTPL